MCSGDELKRSRSLRAKTSARNWRIRIAFDIDDLLVFHIDELATADGAVRAYRFHGLVGFRRPGLEAASAIGERGAGKRGRIAALDLLNDGPVRYLCQA